MILITHKTISQKICSEKETKEKQKLMILQNYPDKYLPLDLKQQNEPDRKHKRTNMSNT